MKVELLTSTAALRSRFHAWTHKANDVWIATAWVTNNCAERKALAAARSKIRALAVGLDFYQSDPAFLRAFRTKLSVCTALGTYHPKIYLFRSAFQFGAILGSSNFTGGGFGKNEESNLYVTGPTTDSLFTRIRDHVIDLHETGRALPLAELTAYAQEFEQRRKAEQRYVVPKKAMKAIADERRAELKDPPTDVSFDWARYVKLVSARDGVGGLVVWRRTDAENGFLWTLRAARAAFARADFAAMTSDERALIGGYSSRGPYFGSMRGAFRFKTLAHRGDPALSKAIDAIPVRGPVTRTTFDTFTRRLAALGEIRVASGSRLLAMKRPDLFLGINAANRRALGAAFELASTRLAWDWDAYWSMHETIWATKWFRSKKPSTSSRQRELWRGRVAMLDVLFYRP